MLLQRRRCVLPLARVTLAADPFGRQQLRPQNQVLRRFTVGQVTLAANCSERPVTTATETVVALTTVPASKNLPEGGLVWIN